MPKRFYVSFDGGSWKEITFHDFAQYMEKADKNPQWWGGFRFAEVSDW